MNNEPTKDVRPKHCPTLGQRTDNDLLAQFTDQNCEGAFEALVSRHSRMVLGICHSVVSNRDCAEDAFQATFLALVRNATRLRNSTSLAGWLCRVARHAAIKASKVQRGRESQSTGEPEVCVDPLNHLAAREMVQSLAEELEAVPTHYKEVLTLFYYESLSRSDIAIRMNCTETAVKGLLHRGKRLLRARLLRRGITPALVVLGINTIGKATMACDSAALVARTTANCLSGISLNSFAPPILDSLSKAINVQTPILNPLIAKSLVVTCVLAVVSLSLSLSWGGVSGPGDSGIALRHSNKETGHNSITVAITHGDSARFENKRGKERIDTPPSHESPPDAAPTHSSLQPLNHRIDTRIDSTISTRTNESSQAMPD